MPTTFIFLGYAHDNNGNTLAAQETGRDTVLVPVLILQEQTYDDSVSLYQREVWCYSEHPLVGECGNRG